MFCSFLFVKYILFHQHFSNFGAPTPLCLWLIYLVISGYFDLKSFLDFDHFHENAHAYKTSSKYTSLFRLFGFKISKESWESRR